MVRLQKYIAMCGEASRRAAEKLIEEGMVTVNGEKITELGTKIEIGADTVKLKGKVLKPKNKMYYIMLNKPAGYVSTTDDQFDRPSVTDLIKNEIGVRMYPIGRLDYETEGLMLLTNDGSFANHVMHPRYNKNKTYIAIVSGGLTISGLNQLRRGVVIDGYKTKPAEIETLDAQKGKTTIKITIHEGRNRQIRKMFEAIGARVDYLQRVSIGNVELGNLPLGRWRHLTSHEISSLDKTVQL
ncbi:MAG: rRNA pseudouridine synthase [Ruminococcaceae bacterium]|nr:rRNA pseudouridine synthase [Oscillospiraceae bacterium]